MSAIQACSQQHSGLWPGCSRSQVAAALILRGEEKVNWSSKLQAASCCGDDPPCMLKNWPSLSAAPLMRESLETILRMLASVNMGEEPDAWPPVNRDRVAPAAPTLIPAARPIQGGACQTVSRIPSQGHSTSLTAILEETRKARGWHSRSLKHRSLWPDDRWDHHGTSSAPARHADVVMCFI